MIDAELIPTEEGATQDTNGTKRLPDLRTLILETLDLLDSSTTLEANPEKMFVMSDPREVAAFIARLDRQKQEQERRNSV